MCGRLGIRCSRALGSSASTDDASLLIAAINNLIELEPERCSLDSLEAFTDEHHCGPAVTQSIHSDDTHSQMWVGSGLTSKAHGPIYSNLRRDSNGKNRKMSLLLLTSVAALWTVKGQLRTERPHVSPLQDKNLPARCSRRPDCTHKLAPSHDSPATAPLTGPLPRRIAARRSE